MQNMTKYVKWLIWLSGVFLCSESAAQQLPLYSQYMMNGFLLNPALTGSDVYTSVNITAREQWVGFTNAPRTHAISAQTRLLRKSFISRSTTVRRKIRRPTRSGRVGIGGYIFSDQNGITNRTGAQFTYAYHIPMDENQLSFGLALSAYQFRINDEDIVLYQDVDPLLDGSDKVLFIPDASFGVMLTSQDYFAGFSVTELFQASLKFGKNNYESYRLHRHYYLMGGYTFDINREFSIQPTVLVKSTTQNIHQIQVDFNTRVYYRDDYWAGISWRTRDAMVIMAGVKFSQYYIGYAFDYTLSNIRKYSFGSHEFMLAAKFGDNARRYRWIQRY
ncbi:MAG TPA: type IX secretion system membrane protein PorP/SprF [Bacteroidetes bacterium]|nr:type IX secretion system membrane protein PorP/SprF [Bacteroidota bacterium]